jgi:hypothetical protein
MHKIITYLGKHNVSDVWHVGRFSHTSVSCVGVFVVAVMPASCEFVYIIDEHVVDFVNLQLQFADEFKMTWLLSNTATNWPVLRLTFVFPVKSFVTV